MTPLRPIRFNKTALLQLETLGRLADEATAKTERAKILSEAHNYLCRLSRPYNRSYTDGLETELLKKEYFSYKRKPYDKSAYGFFFLTPADGYIYIDKIIRFNTESSAWESLPLI